MHFNLNGYKWRGVPCEPNVLMHAQYSPCFDATSKTGRQNLSYADFAKVHPIVITAA